MKLKSVVKKAYLRTKILLDHDVIFAVWFQSKRSRANWGDVLNPVMIEKISGKKPFNVRRYPRTIGRPPVYSVIGSILGHNYFKDYGKRNLVVWGSGFNSRKGRLQVEPREICAVRGPLTRDILKNQGYNCPEVYGDPALLYPMFYKPEVDKKYKLGVIPHYRDKKFVPPSIRENPDILMIDIQGSTNGVVDQICSCQKIASTSLHGMIAADAYGVPSTWIKFPEEDVPGDGIKFHDYFYSVGRSEEKPTIINENTSLDEILESFDRYKLDIDLDELWDACPFRAD